MNWEAIGAVGEILGALAVIFFSGICRSSNSPKYDRVKGLVVPKR